MRVRLDPMRFGPWWRRVSRYPMRRPFSLGSVALLVVLAAVLLGVVLSDSPGSEVPGGARTTDSPEAPVPSGASPTPAGVTGGDASTQAVGRSGAGDPTAQSGADGTTASAGAERRCSPRAPGDVRISDTSPAAAAIELSQAMYDCAHEVGLAFATDADAISALLSRGIRGPLLLVDSLFDVRLANEIRRLAPERIVAAGFDEQVLPRTLADFAFEPVPADQQVTFAPEGGPYDRVWIVDDAEQAGPLAALGHRIGVGVVAVAGDLRAAPAEVRETISAASEVEFLSDFGEDAAWQLDVIRRGDEIPGGGLLMFGSEPGRRLVAMYGHPTSVGLGVLGEQSAIEGVERLGSVVEGYDADGFGVLGTFEIIVTVASAAPGPDGDYSRVTALDVIRPWVEVAAANGLYVVLDLQPGRTDFLTQAKLYEEFLRLPPRRARAGSGVEAEAGPGPHGPGRHGGRGGSQRGLGVAGRSRAGRGPAPEAAHRSPVPCLHDHEPSSDRDSAGARGADPHGRPRQSENQAAHLGCVDHGARRRRVLLGLEELLRRGLPRWPRRIKC